MVKINNCFEQLALPGSLTHAQVGFFSASFGMNDAMLDGSLLLFPPALTVLLQKPYTNCESHLQGNWEVRLQLHKMVVDYQSSSFLTLQAQ